MRDHIAKGLKRRSVTVEAAVKRYNDAAKKLNPPRPRINFKQVLDIAAVGEFDLLRQNRQDIYDKPWSRPAEREAMSMFFKLKRSREEIRRLNIELHRLSQYMESYDKRISDLLARLVATDISMAHQVQKRHILRSSADRIHRSRIQQIENLSGFTGKHYISASTQSSCMPSIIDVNSGIEEDTNAAGHAIDEEVDSEEEYAMFDDVVAAISSISIN